MASVSARSSCTHASASSRRAAICSCVRWSCSAASLCDPARISSALVVAFATCSSASALARSASASAGLLPGLLERVPDRGLRRAGRFELRDQAIDTDYVGVDGSAVVTANRGWEGDVPDLRRNAPGHSQAPARLRRVGRQLATPLGRSRGSLLTTAPSMTLNPTGWRTRRSQWLAFPILFFRARLRLPHPRSPAALDRDVTGEGRRSRTAAPLARGAGAPTRCNRPPAAPGGDRDSCSGRRVAHRSRSACRGSRTRRAGCPSSCAETARRGAF
jgi:hypothetical protein